MHEIERHRVHLPATLASNSFIEEILLYDRRFLSIYVEISILLSH